MRKSDIKLTRCLSVAPGNTLFEPFQGKPVTIETPLGEVSGVLRRADQGQHGGIGTLLIETHENWMLVKAWQVIKR
jgi:hypothetical protein